MMDCTRAADLLDEYVDGTLPESAARDVRDHLLACPACACSEAGLRTLLRRAAQLPAERVPSRDLWPGIQGRIAAGPVPAGRPVPSAARYGWMAAAAVLLVVFTSAITLWVVRRPAPAKPSLAVASPELAALRMSEPDYLQARKALVAALQQRRSSLSPQTVKILDQNLAAMDRALRAMKAALDKDPGNRGLAVLIESTYRQEIQVLMQAASLPANA